MSYILTDFLILSSSSFRLSYIGRIRSQPTVTAFKRLAPAFHHTANLFSYYVILQRPELMDFTLPTIEAQHEQHLRMPAHNSVEIILHRASCDRPVSSTYDSVRYRASRIIGSPSNSLNYLCPRARFGSFIDSSADCPSHDTRDGPRIVFRLIHIAYFLGILKR